MRLPIPLGTGRCRYAPTTTTGAVQRQVSPGSTRPLSCSHAASSVSKQHQISPGSTIPSSCSWLVAVWSRSGYRAQNRASPCTVSCCFEDSWRRTGRCRDASPTTCQEAFGHARCLAAGSRGALMDDACNRSVERCWECERVNHEPIAIRLATPRRAVELSLCRDCYEECYLALSRDQMGLLLSEVRW
jgi:hypothetical protein